jgi:lysophospholipase
LPDAPGFFGAIAGAPDGTRAIAVQDDAGLVRAALTPPGPRGTALILPGRTEYAEKYGRVMSRLGALGLGSVVIDWRGQGLSTRAAGPTGHVGDFAEFARDLALVLAHADVAALPGPRLLLAHSMGGCIGLRALLAGLPVQAAVLSAPMWGLALSPSAERLARLLARTMPVFGCGRWRAPGAGRGFYVLDQPFAGNVLTADPEHYSWMRSHLASHPALGLGGPSYGWLRAAFRAMDALAPLPAPGLPALAFVGGDEAVVAPAAIRARLAHWPDGALVELPGARHEVLMETPAVQERVWAEIGAFLDRAGF